MALNGINQHCMLSKDTELKKKKKQELEFRMHFLSLEMSVLTKNIKKTKKEAQPHSALKLVISSVEF